MDLLRLPEADPVEGQLAAHPRLPSADISSWKLGAISAGAPLRLLMDIFGWRSVIFGVGTMTLVLSLLTWIFM